MAGCDGGNTWLASGSEVFSRMSGGQPPASLPSQREQLPPVPLWDPELGTDQCYLLSAAPR